MVWISSSNLRKKNNFFALLKYAIKNNRSTSISDKNAIGELFALKLYL